jgi:hypothetical protein
MKKFITALLCCCYLITSSGCSVMSIFQKKEKYGCPASANNMGAEKMVTEDANAAKAIKASNKSKYKGGRKIY